MKRSNETPDVAIVKHLIDQLDREDRAALRPWVLAVFDECGWLTEPRQAQRARDKGLPL
jgi:hypothetical protein